MKALERGQLWVMRIHALMTGLVVVAIAAIGDAILRENIATPMGTVIGPVLLLAVYPVFFVPRRGYHAWGYRMEADELHIAHGVWTRVETVVPLARVQHIDVSQGPVERAYGVCRLVLHTAGTMNSRVVLPGLSRDRAEAMRDEIRARIRHGEPQA